MSTRVAASEANQQERLAEYNLLIAALKRRLDEKRVYVESGRKVGSRYVEMPPEDKYRVCEVSQSSKV